MDGINQPADLKAIDVKGMGKTYVRGKEPVRVLHNLDLQVAQGEFLSLMGPSGSGKSTLLNIIAGLDQPSEGDVRVNGTAIHKLRRAELAQWRAANIGFVFQFYNLLPVLNAEQNVEVPLLLTRLNKAQRRKHVAAALELVGLSERAKHKPAELSGGQLQRVSIARAIVSDPAILVCDEPTGDLDRENAEAVLELLRLLNREQRKTIIMVTHDPEAAQYASRQIKLDKGQLADASTTQRVATA